MQTLLDLCTLRTALDTVEGEGRSTAVEATDKRDCAKGREVGCTALPAILRYMRKYRREYGPLEGDTPFTSIYGAGGWNRYPVMPNGEVLFSAFHSDAEGIRRARAAGFRIFE